MSKAMSQPVNCAVIQQEVFPRLLEVLGAKGFQVVGPTVRDGAVVYGELSSADQLPVGWTDEQGGGAYRLKKRAEAALFGYTVGPHSWKKYFHPSAVRLWRAPRGSTAPASAAQDELPPKLALMGVRSCELHAIAIQDKVFLGGNWTDPVYRARRTSVFIVAVNCGQAGGTCFCASMNTGPKATFGFDLALTEVLENGHHHFVVEVGTPQGAEVLQELPHSEAGAEDKAALDRITTQTAAQMGRSMDLTDLKELLCRNYEHPRWDEVAGRCLTCANCTMVCPTCFCTTMEDSTDLTGQQAERWRKWDSCFTLEFSYIHGGSVRASPKARYRQWLTHKLGTWVDQFGTLGCVGCGRCITWCPVGIDLTEEVRAIRQTDGATLGKERKDENS